MKTVTVGALSAAVATILSLATVALAGSGVGGVFNLGQSNSVDATTSLQGTSSSGGQLQVTNQGSASALRADSKGGKGVFGTHASTSGTDPGVEGDTSSTDAAAAAIVGHNSGGGPALKLMVNGNVPPMAVSSTGKVANLNADKVDGVDSSDLVQGGGKVLSQAFTLLAGAASKTLLTVPNVGKFTAKCSTVSGQTASQLTYKNTTSTNLDVMSQVNGQQPLTIEIPPTQTETSGLDARPFRFIWLFSKNNAMGPVTMVTTLQDPTFYGNACIFQASATAQL
jgi:hypothetical protein